MGGDINSKGLRSSQPGMGMGIGMGIVHRTEASRHTLDITKQLQSSELPQMQS